MAALEAGLEGATWAAQRRRSSSGSEQGALLASWSDPDSARKARHLIDSGSPRKTNPLRQTTRGGSKTGRPNRQSSGTENVAPHFASATWHGRDAFNGSTSKPPSYYLNTLRPQTLPSSTISWRQALEQAIASARSAPNLAPPYAPPLTSGNTENKAGGAHKHGYMAPCFHCAEATMARVHEQRLEEEKAHAEADLRAAQKEISILSAREAAQAEALEVLRRRLSEAERETERAEKRISEEHLAAMEQAATWRKREAELQRKSAEEAEEAAAFAREERRKFMRELAEARRDWESGLSLDSSERTRREMDLERKRQLAEAEAKMKEEEMQALRFEVERQSRSSASELHSVRLSLERTSSGNEELKAENQKLKEALREAKLQEETLRQQVAEMMSALESLHSDVSLHASEVHAQRRESARLLTLVADLQQKENRILEKNRISVGVGGTPGPPKTPQEALKEVQGELASAMEKFGLTPTTTALSDGAYAAAMARLAREREAILSKHSAKTPPPLFPASSPLHRSVSFAPPKSPSDFTLRKRTMSLPICTSLESERENILKLEPERVNFGPERVRVPTLETEREKTVKFGMDSGDRSSGPVLEREETTLDKTEVVVQSGKESEVGLEVFDFSESEGSESESWS